MLNIRNPNTNYKKYNLTGAVIVSAKHTFQHKSRIYNKPLLTPEIFRKLIEFNFINFRIKTSII